MIKISEKNTTIYALIQDLESYVGRTTSPRLSAIVYEHCRDEHQSTKGRFDLEDRRPELIILERLSVPSPVAYRHQLAWLHRLGEAGYAVGFICLIGLPISCWIFVLYRSDNSSYIGRYCRPYIDRAYLL